MSVRIICDGDGGGVDRDDRGDESCLWPRFVVQEVSEEDWGGSEGFLTHKYVSKRDIRVGGERWCAWGVNSLNE